MSVRFFDISHACEFGVNEAIFINMLKGWIEHNRANEINFHEGRYWSYNTTRAWSELLPFLTEKQIRTAVDNLVSKKVLIKGNFNKDKFIKTTWYAFEDEKNYLDRNFTSKKGESICPPGQMYGEKNNFSKSEEMFNGEYICPTGQLEETSRANAPIYNQQTYKQQKRRIYTPTPLTEADTHLLEFFEDYSKWTRAEYPHISIDKDKWIKELAKIKEYIEGDIGLLNNILSFIQQDSFWKDKAISPMGLLKLSANGSKKIDNIIAAMKASKSFKPRKDRWVQDPTIPF